MYPYLETSNTICETAKLFMKTPRTISTAQTLPNLQCNKCISQPSPPHHHQRSIHLLLRPRPRHPSTNHTRQRLIANTIHQPNPPTNRRRKSHPQSSKQPKRHTNILLLTSRPIPKHRLRPALPIVRDRSAAVTSPAVQHLAAVVGGFGLVFEEGCAVAGAVVCG